MKTLDKLPCAMAHSHLKKSTKEFSKLLSKNISSKGIIKLTSKSEMGLCAFLARTVVGQQLSTKAARTIWSRVEQEAEGKNVSTKSILVPRYDRSLKACGISKNKRKALYSITEAIATAAINDSMLLNQPHNSRSIQLTEIWGIGQWTADMTSMFYFGDPDIWPSTDGAVVRGLTLFGNGSKRIEKDIVNVSAPYRSYLALHMWDTVDSGLI